MSPDSLNARLRYQFGFSADDLEANRAGRLTDGQRERARMIWRDQIGRRERGFLAAWAIITVALVVWSALRGAFAAQLPVTAALAGCAALVFVIVALLRRYNARDLRSGKLSAAEGEVTLRMYDTGTRAGRQMIYELNIGERTFFRENEAELAAFERGYRYRVYYMRDAPAHLILSAEAVDR